MGWLAPIVLASLASLAAGAGAEPLAPQAAAEARAVKEITIDPNAKEPVCRRAAPTGSRIAKRRCEAPTTASDAARREQLRRDIDEMRTRQILREQARTQALADDLRRRAHQ